PLLERDDSAPAGEGDPERAEAAKSETLDRELARDDFSTVEDLDSASHDNMYDGDRAQPTASAQAAPLADWISAKSGTAFDGEEGRLGLTVADGGTLKDRLSAGGRMAGWRPDLRMRCLPSMDAIDEAGFWRAAVSEVGSRLGGEPADVEEVL